MVGLVISVYNRPDCLKKTLNYLSKSDLPKDLSILIINDASTESRVEKIINGFNPTGLHVVKIKNRASLKVWGTLRKGFDFFYQKKEYEILMNLDSDMIVNPDWFIRMKVLYDRFPDKIISGYNCRLHGGIEKFETFRFKQSIGGANLMFSRKLYPDMVRPFFDKMANWDWKLGLNYVEQGNSFVVTVPSGMQHIGVKSTIRRKGVIPPISWAEDFKPA